MDKPDLLGITKRFPIYEVKHNNEQIWSKTSKMTSASKAIYSLKQLSAHLPIAEQPSEFLGDMSSMLSLSKIDELSMQSAQTNILSPPTLLNRVSERHVTGLLS